MQSITQMWRITDNMVFSASFCCRWNRVNATIASSTEGQFIKKTTTFCSDPQGAFQRAMVDSILVRQGENCTIPCMVTDPEVTLLELRTCDGRPLPSSMSYLADLQRGVIISNMRKDYEGCYVCVGRLGGVEVTSNQYTVDVRLGKWGRPRRESGVAGLPRLVDNEGRGIKQVGAFN